jgi:hypothetical protein
VIKQALEIVKNREWEKVKSVMSVDFVEEQIENFKQELFLTHDNFVKNNSKFLENEDYTNYCSYGEIY